MVYYSKRTYMKRHFSFLLKLATEMFVIIDSYFPSTRAIELVCDHDVVTDLESTEPFSSCSKKVKHVSAQMHAHVILAGTPPGRAYVSDELVLKLGPLYDKFFEAVRRWFFMVPTKVAIYRVESRILVLSLEPERVILADSRT